MRKHNFSAGPSIVSELAKRETAKGVLGLSNGLSIMEISHRSPEFSEIIEDANNILRDLLSVPLDYHVLWLQGGASTQFCMIPYNLLKTKAAYLETGSWSKKAVKEAKPLGEVDVVASSADKNYSYIPKKYKVPEDADYFHITTNNTIYGTEIKTDIDSPVPLIADASSDILSRPIDVSKYGMIYGGAQKNIGPAGVTFVIIREDILGKVDRYIPTMLDYQTHISKGSLYNTPPCLAIYACLHNMMWLKQQGGVEKIHKVNTDKANMLYDEIERNKLFVAPVKDQADRSIMNVTFVMADEYKSKEIEFREFANSRGMSGIKGHRSVGGFRASIYNAMPKESVKALVDTMKEFEAQI
ncbi:MAG: 3-phosphoserine/phosphohydroxythreonine transaminase [Bacteroidales bacterium]|nr:3-phosphoserine/phosphohydroxythreonine transaminase [Bacteroidales bacterium]